MAKNCLHVIAQMNENLKKDRFFTVSIKKFWWDVFQFLNIASLQMPTLVHFCYFCQYRLAARIDSFLSFRKSFRNRFWQKSVNFLFAEPRNGQNPQVQNFQFAFFCIIFVFIATILPYRFEGRNFSDEGSKNCIIE